MSARAKSYSGTTRSGRTQRPWTNQEDLHRAEEVSVEAFSSSSQRDSLLILPEMSYRKRQQRRSKLPGPLRLPKTYEPRLLSPLQEQMLAHRLSRVPERWNEKYLEDAERKRMFVAKRVTPMEAERIVRRLSATPKKDEPKKEIDQHEMLFGFEHDHEPKSNEERKFDEGEVERLVQRLTQVRISSRESSEDETSRRGVYITKYELEKLTERLSRPKTQVDPEAEQLKRGSGSRFNGKKMSKTEMEEFVKRISRNGAKVGNDERHLRKQELGYFATWTPCDADFIKWRMMNRK